MKISCKNKKKIILIVVDGRWSLWSPWTECSQTCGDSFRRKTRTCSSPAPAHGGNPCVGQDELMQACHVPRCIGKVKGHLYCLDLWIHDVYWIDYNAVTWKPQVYTHQIKHPKNFWRCRRKLQYSFDSHAESPGLNLTIAMHIMHFCPSARQFIHIAALNPGV